MTPLTREEIEAAAWALHLQFWLETYKEEIGTANRVASQTWEDEAVRRRAIGQAEVALKAAAALKGVEPQWRDIESAPKDGTRIILLWDGKSREGYFLDNSTSPQPWKGWKLTAMDPWPKGQPTHWMPLPAPPSNQEGAGDGEGVAGRAAGGF